MIICNVGGINFSWYVHYQHVPGGVRIDHHYRLHHDRDSAAIHDIGNVPTGRLVEDDARNVVSLIIERPGYNGREGYRVVNPQHVHDYPSEPRKLGPVAPLLIRTVGQMLDAFRDGQLVQVADVTRNGHYIVGTLQAIEREDGSGRSFNLQLAGNWTYWRATY